MMRKALTALLVVIIPFAISTSSTQASGGPLEVSCPDPSTSIGLTIVATTPGVKPDLTNDCTHKSGPRDGQTVLQEVTITCEKTKIILSISVVGEQPDKLVDPAFTFVGTCLPQGDKFSFATASLLCDGLTFDVSFEAQTSITDQRIPFGPACTFLPDQMGVPKG